MGQPALVAAPLPAGVTGFFTTRYGGVSAGPWSALNLGWHVGDVPAAVATNHDRLVARLGSGPIAFPDQEHGAAVGVCGADGRSVFGPFGPSGPPGPTHGAGPVGCDALVTAEPGVSVGVLVADCLPVLLADPVAGVVAAAHAGRRGLAVGVLQATVAAMAALGGRPPDMRAVIGPGIGACCYEVSAEVQQEVMAAVPDTAAKTSWGTLSLNLPAGAAAVLRDSGVGRVAQVGLCTAEDQRFYSYRRDGVTGRFAGVVVRPS